MGPANYRCVDYRDDSSQSVVGFLKLGTDNYSIDHTVNAEVHRSLRGRNSYSNGGGPDDSANYHSCGVVDWGSKGATIDTGCPYGNTLFQIFPPCCNRAWRLLLVVPPLCFMGVLAHEVACDQSGAQFGGLEHCLCSLACCIHIAPHYGPLNGR